MRKQFDSTVITFINERIRNTKGRINVTVHSSSILRNVQLVTNFSILYNTTNGSPGITWILAWHQDVLLSVVVEET